MVGLILWFNNPSQPQLERTEFSHPLLGGKQEANRGKTGGASTSPHTFQWSPAVRSLSLLLLLNALWGRKSSQPDPAFAPRLVGGEGSAAASLDYALGKLPAWLMDMFGMDSRGTALARRLVRRSNPERRRGGECALALNLSMLPAVKIEIYLDGRLVAEEEELDRMIGNIRAQCCERRPAAAGACCGQDSPAQAAGPARPAAAHMTARAEAAASELNAGQLRSGPLPRPFDQARRMEEWRASLLAELRWALNDTAVFNRAAYRASVDRICEEACFRRLSAGRGRPVSEADLNMPASLRLGAQGASEAMRRTLARCGPLRAALAVDQLGALAVFRYLKLGCRVPLESDFSCLNAAEMAPFCIQGDFPEECELCVLGLPAAAQVLAQGDRSVYRPLMLLPKSRQRVVSAGRDPGRRDELGQGRYLVPGSPGSGGAMYFQRLAEAGALDARRVSVTEAEVDEMTALLAEDDGHSRAVMGYPFYWFSQVLGRCRLIDDEWQQLGVQESVLFAHQRIFHDAAAAQAVCAALRSAWMDLREQSAALELMCDVLAQDRALARLLGRAGGLEFLAREEEVRSGGCANP